MTEGRRHQVRTIRARVRLFPPVGDNGIVAGSETVVPAPDAGKTVRRRFTEVGVRRDGIVLAPDDVGKVID